MFLGIVPCLALLACSHKTTGSQATRSIIITPTTRHITTLTGNLAQTLQPKKATDVMEDELAVPAVAGAEAEEEEAAAGSDSGASDDESEDESEEGSEDESGASDDESDDDSDFEV